MKREHFGALHEFCLAAVELHAAMGQLTYWLKVLIAPVGPLRIFVPAGIEPLAVDHPHLLSNANDCWQMAAAGFKAVSAAEVALPDGDGNAERLSIKARNRLGGGRIVLGTIAASSAHLLADRLWLDTSLCFMGLAGKEDISSATEWLECGDRSPLTFEGYQAADYDRVVVGLDAEFVTAIAILDHEDGGQAEPWNDGRGVGRPAILPQLAEFASVRENRNRSAK